MNKKIIVAAACGALLSGVVCAEDLKFYVGADVGYNKLGYTKDFKAYLNSAPVTTAKSKMPSATVKFGVRPHENFGAEIGYTFNKKLKVSQQGVADTHIKTNSMYVDLLGYMPINTCFDAVASVGMGRFNEKIVGDFKANTNALRFGAGVEYKIDANFAANAMVRYQSLGNVKEDGVNSLSIKRNTSLNLGLNYTF